MSSDRGFTLLETLVAFTALAVVLAAAYGAFASGARGAAAGATRLEALARAESALTRAATVLTPGARERREGGWIERVRVGPSDRDGPGLWRIEATVLWRESGIERRLDLATLRPGTPR